MKWCGRWRDTAKLAVLVGAVVALAMLAGCGAPGFRVDGALASQGGRLGTWTWRPQGCIRAPSDAKASGTAAVASLLWIDPVRRDASRANGHQFTVEDAPVRLDLERVGGQPVAVLETVRTRGTEFNAANCRTLTLETREERPTLAGGRPSLAGMLRMDCAVEGSRFTAQVLFRGCDY